MSEISAKLRASLEGRIREQIAAEVRRDAEVLYGITLPAYRAARIAERDDEPELSLTGIRQFVQSVDDAEIQSVEVESFYPAVDRFAGSAAAVVVTLVRYNRRSEASRFRCIWVHSHGTWYSTALGKFWLGAPPESAVDVFGASTRALQIRSETPSDVGE
jgi:hypothetical protein